MSRTLFCLHTRDTTLVESGNRVRSVGVRYKPRYRTRCCFLSEEPVGTRLCRLSNLEQRDKDIFYIRLSGPLFSHHRTTHLCSTFISIASSTQNLRAEPSKVQGFTDTLYSHKHNCSTMRAVWNGYKCILDPIGKPKNQHPLRSLPSMSSAPFHYISLRKIGMYKYTAAISILYLLS